jgi:hypothetical protein
LESRSRFLRLASLTPTAAKSSAEGAIANSTSRKTMGTLVIGLIALGGLVYLVVAVLAAEKF